MDSHSIAAQWPPQEIVVKTMEEIVRCPNPNPNSNSNSKGSIERKIRPQKEQIVHCPRCNSTNTKFCYYNNYSLSQPRYFCKTCRRYWTEGGSLRNIPVGGGSRKNKRSSSSTATSPSIHNSDKKLQDLVQNPNLLETHDLNLGFSLHQRHHHHHRDFKTIADMIHLPSSPLPPPPNQNLSSMGLSSFMAAPPLMPPPSAAAMYAAEGFAPLPEFKTPALNFSLESYGSFQGVQETSGKLLFPFEDLKQQVSSSSSNNNNEDNNNNNGDLNRDNEYWNGVIGGGGGSW